jgi:ASC-1-like (ASCH) protein
MKIEKKILPEYFEKIQSGQKTFELRLADWECNTGDVLVLREIDEKRNYTGRSIKKEVIYVLKTKDICLWPKEDVEKYGYQIISFR